jgi:hypothetical protein
LHKHSFSVKYSAAANEKSMQAVRITAKTGFSKLVKSKTKITKAKQNG